MTSRLKTRWFGALSRIGVSAEQATEAWRIDSLVARLLMLVAAVSNLVLVVAVSDFAVNSGLEPGTPIDASSIRGIVALFAITGIVSAAYFGWLVLITRRRDRRLDSIHPVVRYFLIAFRFVAPPSRQNLLHQLVYWPTVAAATAYFVGNLVFILSG